MQNEVAVCVGVARGMRYFPEDAAPALTTMLLGMARTPAQVLRFVAVLRDSGLVEWPGWNEIRALWCRHIGIPADGRLAESQVAGGEQPTEGFPGCPDCVQGWRQVVRVFGSTKYTAVEECECRRRAVLAAGGVPAALPGVGQRAACRDGLQRADALALLAGKGEES